jgi:hypothetical protein
MDHRDLAVAGAKNLEIGNPDVLHPASHSRGWDFGSQPSAFAVAPLEVLLRSLPPFPIYSLAGAVDGGKDVSGDCGNAGALRAGVGGLPGVLSTKVRVLLRPGVLEGYLGELGTTSVVSSCVCFRLLFQLDRLPFPPLLGLSAANRPRLCGYSQARTLVRPYICMPRLDRNQLERYSSTGAS